MIFNHKTPLSLLSLPLLAFVAPVFPPLLASSPQVAQEVRGFQPQTIEGQLDTSDPTLPDGSYYEIHTFSGDAGQSVVIEMSSEEFDTYLILRDEAGNAIAENDDRDVTNSRIAVTLPNTGTYTVVAHSYDVGAIGSYTLRLRDASVQEVELEAQLVGHLA